jgi:Tol biopolymer transport system component
VDHEGIAKPLPFPESSICPRVSPDGREIMVSRREEPGGAHSLWLSDVERLTCRRLNDGAGSEWWGVWSPDGSAVIHNSTRLGDEVGHLFVKPVHDADEPDLLVRGEGLHLQPCGWTPDGKLLIYQSSHHPETGLDIWAISPYEGGKPYPVLRTRFDEFHPAISPNSRWLAYTSDETGERRVMIRPFPGPGKAMQVSNERSQEPLWSPDGRTLYYRCYQGGHHAMAVAVAEENGDLDLGEPRELFRSNFFGAPPYGRMWDIDPDGTRFLMIQQNELPPAPREYRLVVRWWDDLKKMVPPES